jgi:hypothetical protein
MDSTDDGENKFKDHKQSRPQIMKVDLGDPPLISKEDSESQIDGQVATKDTGRKYLAAPTIDESAQPGPWADLFTMKKEIDALQIQLAKKDAPWYKQVAVLVSVAALLLSLVTTYYSQRNAADQAMQVKRNDLRQVITQYGEQAVAASELSGKYPDNPNRRSIAAGHISTQMKILVDQEVELVDEMGDRATASELNAVASNLTTIGDSRAPRYYELGIKKADNLQTTTMLLRGLASYYFVRGGLDEGRKSYGRAIEAIHQTKDSPETWKISEEAFAELTWSSHEIQARQCALARVHYDKAVRLYSVLGTKGWDLSAVSPQIDQGKSALAKQC